MILGTANFGNTYRGVNHDKDTCYKLLKYFEDNGGELLDCAYDYNNKNIIYQYLTESKLKIIMKISNEHDDIEDYSDVYCYMMRVYNKQINDIIKNRKIVSGLAVYYPHEMRQNVGVFSIPNSDIFLPYLDVMKLHAKVYSRSIYTLAYSEIYKKCDDVIVGVDNLEQLKRNMERFDG